MPIVELHLVEGYDDDSKRRLGEGLTDAVRRVVPADPDAVTVLIHDHPVSNYMRGRRRRSGAPGLPPPADLVRRYLEAMDARDLDAAAECLDAEFEMIFPNAPAMHRLSELADWAAPRYRRIGKCIEAVDTCPAPGPAVVYARGRLHGEWPDGTAFTGIRFVDRFEIRGGRIVRQEVWNDIAEVRR